MGTLWFLISTCPKDLNPGVTFQFGFLDDFSPRIPLLRKGGPERVAMRLTDEIWHRALSLRDG